MVSAVTRKDRGVALATALMLSVLLLVLGIALLSTSQRDLYFQRQQDARDKAELLARSGWEHCLYLASQNPPELDGTLPLNSPRTLNVLPPSEVIVLERKSDSGRIALSIRGEVRRSNGELLASRTIIVPYGTDGFITQSEFLTQSYVAEL